MAWTKAKTGLITAVVVLLAAGTTTVTIKEIQNHRNDAWEMPMGKTADVLNKVPPQVAIVPTKFKSGGMRVNDGKMMGIYQPLSNIFPHAYRVNWSHTICEAELPSGRFDFISNLRQGSAEALQREIERKFGLVAKHEMRDTDVLLLTVKTPDMPGLRPTGGRVMQLNEDSDRFSCKDSPISVFCDFLGSCFHVPVIEGPGFSQNYDIDLKWDKANSQETLEQALSNQLGLELVPTNLPLDMLVVKKAK